LKKNCCKAEGRRIYTGFNLLQKNIKGRLEQTSFEEGRRKGFGMIRQDRKNES
jgi:hypothetical protein